MYRHFIVSTAFEYYFGSLFLVDFRIHSNKFLAKANSATNQRKIPMIRASAIIRLAVFMPFLVPGQCAADLVVDNAGFEEVFLFLQIEHFAHPGKWILGTRILLRQSDLSKAAIGNKFQIF